MGCSHSSSEVDEMDASEEEAGGYGAPSRQMQAAPPQAKKTNDRVDAIDRTRTIETGGIRMRFAYLSQRGKYPDDPDKPNQDAYCIKHNFANQMEDAFFGVFDGHGKDGHGCAQFTRTHLPALVERFVEKGKAKVNAGPNADLTREQTHAALTKAHVECNKHLHKNTHIDDSLSGTTAISAYVHGKRNRITIANVGDSRAVLGQEVTIQGQKSLKALPLSRDQTPYRKDERKRIRQTGARILSLDQLEGLEPIPDEDSDGEGDLVLGEELDEGGDPPRVWSPNGDYPGTAFTRSVGDAMAEELGVFAEPELLTREINSHDKIIVLASDGVFEFLTNQSVIDICAKFSDPLEACRAVVAESYELWLQYELRTDDITIICIFVDNVDESVARRNSLMGSSSRGNGNQEAAPQRDEVDTIIPATGLRPVRKTMTKEKSKAIEKLKKQGAAIMDVSPDIDIDLKSMYSEKTDSEKKRISDAIKASVMFRNITEEQKEMIFGVMESVDVKKGTWVIKQGTVGDRFYIIDEGRFEVRIVPDGEEDRDGSGGHTVHVYEGSVAKHAHPCFGELALMYSAPRSASIIAQSDGHLWALHRLAFRQVLAQSQDTRQDLKKALAKIPAFRRLDSHGLDKIAAAMDESTYGRGENIIEQGKKCVSFYVVASGQCGKFKWGLMVSQILLLVDFVAYAFPSLFISSELVKRVNGKVQHTTCRTGDFFGEEALKGPGVRYNSTVVALQTTSCWQMDAASMSKVVLPLIM
jgi:serine/threonine protein phosphatase PrpC/CRP-like cAMP-binding protein